MGGRSSITKKRERAWSLHFLNTLLRARRQAGCSGSAFPAFKGNFFFGCLRGEAMIRVVLDGRRVVSQEQLVTKYGRIRDVAEGPDGLLYFSTSNRDGRGKPTSDDDRILKLVPASQ